MPDKKHKAIRSNKKDAIYDLMADFGFNSLFAVFRCEIECKGK